TSPRYRIRACRSSCAQEQPAKTCFVSLSATAGVDVVQLVGNRWRNCSREERLGRHVPDQRGLVVAADTGEPLHSIPYTGHDDRVETAQLLPAAGGLARQVRSAQPPVASASQFRAFGKCWSGGPRRSAE